MVTASCYFLTLSVHAKSLIKNAQVLLKNLKCVVENAKSKNRCLKTDIHTTDRMKIKNAIVMIYKVYFSLTCNNCIKISRMKN